MVHHFRIIWIILFALAATGVNAQDTSAIVHEFNKVMSFTTQPYLYYRINLKMETSPVLQTEDTLTSNGEFYKNGNNFYYTNGHEEIFLEDSIFLQINNDKKTIWISKVDEDTKAKMNFLPLTNKGMQKMFRKEYVITQSNIGKGDTASLNFENRVSDTVSAVSIKIDLKYLTKNLLPLQMVLQVNMKRPVTDEMARQLKSRGGTASKRLQMIDKTVYLTRTQRMVISFEGIDNSKDKAMQLPVLGSRITYSDLDMKFSSKGIYKDYEITSTF